jgi:hypothetical protein
MLMPVAATASWRLDPFRVGSFFWAATKEPGHRAGLLIVRESGGKCGPGAEKEDHLARQDGGGGARLDASFS